MALSAGTVSVNNSGVASGSGLAKAMYDGWKNVLNDHYDDMGEDLPNSQIPYLKFRAKEFTGIAAAIVNHIKNNAEVTVTITPSDAGLQRTPDPNDPNVDTQGPSDDVELTGEID